ncbi:hypothetical protein BJD20_01905 [Acinetobacter proteolyticus]|uniref:hypothetical protein n=1 Tax=Acinetobacter proteolyticus TaxID=1776741 RepID=UPI0008633CC4|nr:hypothetical protein [Acinetobacter proteolyticus]OEY96797.1 hypothetical protein BJD20_01905 [Acinetobacter proteolyticus]
MAITEQQIFEMIQHWLASKENGYFGSSYGGLDIALAPPDGQLNIESCKEFMTKLQEDIPILVERPLTRIVKSIPIITFYFSDEHRTYNL